MFTIVCKSITRNLSFVLHIRLNFKHAYPSSDSKLCARVVYIIQYPCKAQFTLATMSKQHLTSLPTATMSDKFVVKYHPYDKGECCFDIVAVFVNNVQRVFREISSFRQSRNKLNMFILFQLYRKDEISFDIVAKTATVSKQRSTLSKQHSTVSEESFDVAFDNVASTLLLVWTGLNVSCIELRLERVLNIKFVFIVHIISTLRDLRPC